MLTLSGPSSIANYKAALESITYDNTNDNNPNTSNRTITWIVNDGDNNSASATSTITVAGSNDAPTGADAGATLAYTEGNGAQVIDSTLTLADVDDTNLESATIQITSGYQSGEDLLAFSNQSKSLEAGTVRLEHCRCLYSNKRAVWTALAQSRIPFI